MASALVTGWNRLTAIFGDPPDLHDAEILSIRLEMEAKAGIKFCVFSIVDNRKFTVELNAQGVMDVAMSGFSYANIVDRCVFEFLESSCKLEAHPTPGVGTTLSLVAQRFDFVVTELPMELPIFDL